MSQNKEAFFVKFKKICAVLMAALLCVCVCVPTFAAGDESRVVSRTVEQYDNGAYAVITVYEDAASRATGSKNGHKAFDYYESGTLQWTYTLHASFTYNGSTATCTAATATFDKQVDIWKLIANDPSPSGSAAIARGVVQKTTTGKKVSPTVTITCTPNGVLA